MTAGLRQTAERDGEDGGRRIHVVQGEYHVSGDDDAVLTTILGSCVSACLRDPLAGIGGMNHFLLPGDGSQRRQEAQSYGVHLMELLVNGLLRRGARRERLEAKLFGGASTVQGLSNVGTLNADFAESFLSAEGIHVIGGSLRGSRGRRVQYWPISGRARQVFLAADLAPPPVFTAPLAQAGTGGSVEFF